MSDELIVEMRSAPEGEPWGEWFTETVPTPLWDVLQGLGEGITVTYTYRDGFRDEFRRINTSIGPSDEQVARVQEILARDETKEELMEFHAFLAHRHSLPEDHDDATCPICSAVSVPTTEGETPVDEDS